jgi:hypothetical protein
MNMKTATSVPRFPNSGNHRLYSSLEFDTSTRICASKCDDIYIDITAGVDRIQV